jgi:hypothetical protein
LSLLQHFQSKPETYNMDPRKIQFAISHLKGAAKSHITTRTEQDPADPLFFEWMVFIKEMRQYFGEYNPRGVSQRKMCSIRMGEKEMFVNYIVRFQEDALDSGFNDSALKSLLHQTINTKLLKMLVTVPEADTYAKLVEQCLTLDQQVDDVDAELKLRAAATSSGFTSAVP